MHNHSEFEQDLETDVTDNAPLEKTFDRLITPFEEFVHNESSSGLVLMVCTVLALIAANTALAHTYHQLLHAEIGFHIGGFALTKTTHHWINDGLMTLFFLLVGLEIKREVLTGELADPRRAALPIVAAVGGMLVPAALYFAINHEGPALDGWGIPMATDIAFAVGVLVLLGGRVPKPLFTFLIALAIVDDLGAVAVIAVFYTKELNLEALELSGILFLIMMGLNFAGVRRPGPYFILGALLWLAMLKSGVHATIAGVLTALTIPAKSKYDPRFFSGHVRKLMDRFDSVCVPGTNLQKCDPDRSYIQALKSGIHKIETPLQRVEHRLHLPVSFFVMPVFALANAGIPLELSTLGATLSHPVTVGVMLGLVGGKFLGITLFSWAAIKIKLCSLPTGTRLPHLASVGLLAGIGFTMSIFIAELAFEGQAQQILRAKTGILLASLMAGLAGAGWLYWLGRPKEKNV